MTRFRLAATLTLLCAMIWAPSRVVLATASEAGPRIVVREERGLYRVSAHFTVPESPSIIKAVLSDYEQIPRFMPEVVTSTVVARTDGRVMVEQEVLARFMLFSKRLRLLLEVDEEPWAIRFRDRCGQSFVQYEGVWQMTESNEGVTIGYELVARPAFGVPQWVLKRLLARDAKGMIERLRIEFAQRSQQR